MSMESNVVTNDRGSILLVALFTITILTMLCATSLYITTQNSNAGMLTASWQQALTAAESGVDEAIRALNEDGTPGSNAWTNWISVGQSGNSLPTTEPSPSPSPSPAATAPPDSSHYNYLPSSKLSISFPTTEGATSVSAWVTIDTAGMQASQDTNGKQWYRVRSTGKATISGPGRVSNNRLDNDLRNTIALRFNRKGGNYVGPTRTIEVILSPVTSSNTWVRGVTTLSQVTISGSGIIDSFDSSNSLYSTNGLYDSTKRESHGDVGIANSTGSNFNSQYVYGNVAYSGPAIQNTQNVKGTISTPFTTSVTTPQDPSIAYATNGYTTVSGNPPPATIDATGGTKASPVQIKINGQFQLSGSNVLNITGGASATAANPAYLTIWVTDQWQTSGSSVINQSSNVKVTWYVDKQIQLSGSSYNNQGGVAANVSFVGTGTNQNFQISGSSDFIGTVNAPNYAVQLSGSGSLMGALMAKSLAISGSGGVHYDQTLGAGNNGLIGNYAFASWFEDNSTPTHKGVNGNYVIY